MSVGHFDKPASKHDIDMVSAKEASQKSLKKSNTSSKNSRRQSEKSYRGSAAGSSRSRRRAKLPLQIDLNNRWNPDCQVSELSDEDLPIGYDSKGNPKEIIFSELNAGSYFGELGMNVHGDDKEKEKMREIRYGLCFTSVWAVQNTHLFYIEDKDFKDVQAEIKKRI